MVPNQLRTCILTLLLLYTKAHAKQLWYWCNMTFTYFKMVDACCEVRLDLYDATTWLKSVPKYWTESWQRYVWVIAIQINLHYRMTSCIISMFHGGEVIQLTKCCFLDWKYWKPASIHGYDTAQWMMKP